MACHCQTCAWLLLFFFLARLISVYYISMFVQVASNCHAQYSGCIRFWSLWIDATMSAFLAVYPLANLKWRASHVHSSVTPIFLNIHACTTRKAHDASSWKPSHFCFWSRPTLNQAPCCLDREVLDISVVKQGGLRPAWDGKSYTNL